MHRSSTHGSVYCSVHTASHRCSVPRGTNVYTKYNTFVRAIRASLCIYSSPWYAFVPTKYTKLFHRDDTIYTSEPTRHADVPFFFYYVIETLAALLRADLIYYPCDCTELLITELRQLRRTTYTFVHASYLSATHSSQQTFFPDTFLSLPMIKEHVLSRATHLHFFFLRSASQRNQSTYTRRS